MTDPLLADLARTRDETLAFFALPDADLDRRYGPDKWSVRFILHHLADAETVLFDRIRRTISTEHPVVWGFDQDAWASSLDYGTRDLDIAKAIYGAVRAGIIHEAERHLADKGHRTFVHSRMGVRTLKDEFEKVVWHNEQHLDQIRRARIRGEAG